MSMFPTFPSSTQNEPVIGEGSTKILCDCGIALKPCLTSMPKHIQKCVCGAKTLKDILERHEIKEDVEALHHCPTVTTKYLLSENMVKKKRGDRRYAKIWLKILVQRAHLVSDEAFVKLRRELEDNEINLGKRNQVLTVSAEHPIDPDNPGFNQDETARKRAGVDKAIEAVLTQLAHCNPQILICPSCRSNPVERIAEMKCESCRQAQKHKERVQKKREKKNGLLDSITMGNLKRNLKNIKTSQPNAKRHRKQNTYPINGNLFNSNGNSSSSLSMNQLSSGFQNIPPYLNLPFGGINSSQSSDFTNFHVLPTLSTTSSSSSASSNSGSAPRSPSSFVISSLDTSPSQTSTSSMEMCDVRSPSSVVPLGRNMSDTKPSQIVIVPLNDDKKDATVPCIDGVRKMEIDHFATTLPDVINFPNPLFNDIKGEFTTNINSLSNQLMLNGSFNALKNTSSRSSPSTFPCGQGTMHTGLHSDAAINNTNKQRDQHPIVVSLIDNETKNQRQNMDRQIDINLQQICPCPPVGQTTSFVNVIQPKDQNFGKYLDIPVQQKVSPVQSNFQNVTLNTISLNKEQQQQQQLSPLSLNSTSSNTNSNSLYLSSVCTTPMGSLSPLDLASDNCSADQKEESNDIFKVAEHDNINGKEADSVFLSMQTQTQNSGNDMFATMMPLPSVQLSSLSESNKPLQLSCKANINNQNSSFKLNQITEDPNKMQNIIIDSNMPFIQPQQQQQQQQQQQTSLKGISIGAFDEKITKALEKILKQMIFPIYSCFEKGYFKMSCYLSQSGGWALFVPYPNLSESMMIENLVKRSLIKLFGNENLDFEKYIRHVQ